jgi:hypothetical protein
LPLAPKETAVRCTFKIAYIPSLGGGEEVLEADEYTIDDKWAVFSSEFPGVGKLSVLRIRVENIQRIEGTAPTEPAPARAPDHAHGQAKTGSAHEAGEVDGETQNASRG